MNYIVTYDTGTQKYGRVKFCVNTDNIYNAIKAAKKQAFENHYCFMNPVITIQNKVGFISV